MKKIRAIAEMANRMFASAEEKGFANQSYEDLKTTTESLLGWLRELEYYIASKPLDEVVEIYCNKKVKPCIAGRALFLHSVARIEKSYNIEILENRPSAYEKVIAQIKDFIDTNKDLFWYYKSDESSKDNLFFLRKHFDTSLSWSSLSLDSNSIYHSCRSKLFADFICCELLTKYINDRIQYLEEHPNNISELYADCELSWTDTKAALVELGYALYASGSINFGNANIKEIMDVLISSFEIPMEGNEYYRIYTDLKSRKKNRTAYLDKLELNLVQKMEDDEK